MTRSCERLDGYVDGGLSDAERDAFEDHLLHCAACQQALEDGMQIAAAGAELAGRRDRPFAVVAHARRGRWLAIGAAVAAAATAVIVWRVVPRDKSSVEDRIAASLGPHRVLVARLPYAPLDRHRPYDTPRGDAPVETIPYAVAGELEEQRAFGALASVLVARHDLEGASKILTRSGGDDVALAWSALELVRNRPLEVLPHADAVLAKKPSSIAAWNRAWALKQLDLPLASAEMFRAVAAAGEPGWSAEATALATELETHEAARSARWFETRKACEDLALGKATTAAADAASVCRPSFYEALRAPRTPAELEALASVATAMDRDTGATAAQDLLRLATSPERVRAVATYAKLKAATSEAEKLPLLDELRRSGYPDLVLGGIARTNFAKLRGEYITRALASKDPYFIELAHEYQAKHLLAQGDPIAAEALLVPLVKTCAGQAAELRCAYLMFALAEVYRVLHQPEKGTEVLHTGLARAHRLGTYWDERLYFDHLGDAARLAGKPATVRAYVREATLRTGSECAQERFAFESLAETSVDMLAFAQARRDIDDAPLCNEPPNINRLRILAELAHVDGTPADRAAATAGFAALRTTALPPGERAQLDAMEGRLLAVTDPAAATVLLRRAIAASAAARGDVDAQKARADAFASLIILAAAAPTPDDAALLALFAEATGVTDATGCILAAMADADRVVLVAKTGPTQYLRHFDPRGRKTAAIDGPALVPSKIRSALAGCPRIDVLALPPVFGIPELLPADLPWSYRGRTARSAAPKGASPTVLAIADTRPPADLHLPPLATAQLAPIANTTHVDLRGIAATPSRTLQELPRADVIEIHSHGYMTMESSLIALSPDADGTFTLNARDIAARPLPRSPIVVLAACHAGYSAPYRHQSWGLPHAFLVAGARVVLASRETIPDREAAPFFRDIEAKILAGTDPAVALRDARVQAVHTNPESWTRSVLLFD